MSISLKSVNCKSRGIIYVFVHCTKGTNWEDFVKNEIEGSISEAAYSTSCFCRKSVSQEKL